MSTIDVQALVQRTRESGKVGALGGGEKVTLTLSDEFASAYADYLEAFPLGEYVPIPAELIPAEAATLEPKKRVTAIAEAVRARFVRGAGGNGRFVWVSQGMPSEGAIERDPSLNGMIFLKRSATVPESSKAHVKHTKPNPYGKWNTDGTPADDDARRIAGQ